MTDHYALLTIVPQRRTHWSSFVASYAIQATALIFLLSLNLIRPAKLELLEPRESDVIHLVAMEPAPQREAVRPSGKLIPRAETPKLKAEVEMRPVLRVPKIIESAPRLDIPKPVLASVLPPAPKKPAPQIVRTGVFSTGSQAVPTAALRPRDVQTGGFGDPNGLAGTGKVGDKRTIATAGSFDLPAGPGYGNGTGQSHGVHGTVASTGFGTAVAQGNTNGSSSHAIQQTGFGDARVVAEAVRPPRPVSQSAANLPVQILAKPNPVYTEEARQLRLEGEVLLEVAFSASGEARVIRVLRGLGHGLDEAAVRSAQHIRFRPATRDGEPVDSTAMVHVVFQLAY